MNSISIKNLSKEFDKFKLDNISLELKQGTVLGVIGENGAGKSTLIKLILGLLHKTSGEILVFDKPLEQNETKIKEDIGYVSELTALPSDYKPYYIDKVFKKIYPKWNSDEFFKYLDKFKIDQKKKFSDLSRGMRAKLSLATSLCHDAKLLILDEPTSGLDPVVRNEVLDILREFMLDETHSILISSHITSDLESIADEIAFIHNGKLIFHQSMIEINENYGFIRCTKEDLKNIPQNAVYATRDDLFGVEALINPQKISTNVDIAPANLDQIMLFLTR